MGQAQPELDEVGVRRAPAPRRSGGPGLLLATLVLVVAVVVAVVVLRAADSTGATEPQVPTAPVVATPDPETVRQDAWRTLLRTRADAVLARDADAWLATTDPLATDFAARQAAVFANLGSVPVEAWRYDLAGNGPSPAVERVAALAADDVRVVRVVLSYRLLDSGGGDVRREQFLTFVQRDDRWWIADDADGRTATDLWDLGPVHVVRGERALVVGTADPATLDRFARETDAAAQRVDEVWGTSWPRTVVVMVPQDQGQLAALLGRDSDAGLDQIAAVTTGEIGLDTAATSADRIIVNPDGFAGLGTLGREVVLTHETTHVATRATATAAVPIWLSEGFADYVAYSGTRLGDRDVVRDALPAVRDGRTPVRLPDATDFDPTVTDISPAYAGSWLAVRMIADRLGEQGLVAFLQDVAGAGAGAPAAPPDVPGAPSAVDPVEAAFATHLGTTVQAFTLAWMDELERLAG